MWLIGARIACLMASATAAMRAGCCSDRSSRANWSPEKRDSASDHDGRDIAILISFALQHGAQPDDLARAMTRDAEGRAQGLAGILLDATLAMLADAGRAG